MADGRIELLLAGFYEPVLASLPRTDRIEQIQWMHEAILRRFGVDARGLWLSRDQLHAPFWTESGGRRVALFPIDERLR